jgi:hypothetical protein
MQRAAIARDRCNARYLPGISLPDSLEVVHDHGTAIAHATDGLVVIATPTGALREIARALRNLAPATAIVWLCKGFEEASGMLAHQVVTEELGATRSGAGPLRTDFALGGARAADSGDRRRCAEFCSRVTVRCAGALRVLDRRCGRCRDQRRIKCAGDRDRLRRAGLGLSARAA